MSRVQYGFWIGFIMLLAISCKEPFIPEVSDVENSFLVVEGSINIGPGQTSINLSRTVPLGHPFAPAVVTGARVSIEGEDQTAYALSEEESGYYAASLDLAGSTSYRVHIVLNNGKEYLSDFTSPVKSPAIDSLTWKLNDAGVTVLFNSHGEGNGIGYYQFEYEETWELRSFFFSLLRYENKQLSYRPDESIQALYRCWKSSSSPDLAIYSTGNQTSDVVKDYPIVFIPVNTERLSQRYSILVRQRALSREGYEYLRLMKKNTGPLGSFTDPQPAALRGNIICTTTDEPVVGYIGTYKSEEIRIFISRWDLPKWNYDLACKNVRMLNHPDTLAKYLTSGHDIPTEPAVVLSGGQIIELYRSRDICTDCHSHGGNNIQPDYWN